MKPVKKRVPVLSPWCACLPATISDPDLWGQGWPGLISERFGSRDVWSHCANPGGGGEAIRETLQTI